MEINFFGGSIDASFEDHQISQLRQHLIDTTSSHEIGFLSSLSQNRLLDESKVVHDRFKNKTKFFHIGIGGSSLGPEMLISALRSPQNKVDFTFINNIDPDEIHEQISSLQDPSDALFYIVSKSGGTSETIAAAILVINTLKQKFNIKDAELKDYLILCTDPKNGDLRKLSTQLNLTALEVPPSVGGRFSVLTPVGFLPALFANIDIEKIIESAKNFATKELSSSSNVINTSLRLEHLRINSGISQTVLMPYSSKLKNFSAWFVQLWAESLGKKQNLNGETVNNGLTPIQSYGATDQHSQMQLFVEGPLDKAFFLINIRQFRETIKLKNDVDLESFKSLSPFSINELMQAEFFGAKQTLIDQKRPLFNLEIDELNEKSLGELIMFFELLTVSQGYLLNINPFDQPGVESGKIYTKKWLDDHQ